MELGSPCCYECVRGLAGSTGLEIARGLALIHSLTLTDSRHTYSYFVTALHATANEAESMPIV